jgi:hydrogenase-4 component A
MFGGAEMNRFVIAEASRCIGCNTCMAACATAHKAAGLQSQPRLTLTKTADVSAPVLCRHCEEAFCLRVCPVNAITQDDVHNRVVVDEKTCVGCKMCALACPFGAITPSGTGIAGVAGVATTTPTFSGALAPTLAWEVGVKAVAVKCDLCAFNPEGPACIRVCPTKALVLVDHDAMVRANVVKKTGNAWPGSGMSIETALATFKERE